MKRLTIITAAVLLGIFWIFGATSIMASDKFSYDGQIRLRGELDLTQQQIDEE